MKITYYSVLYSRLDENGSDTPGSYLFSSKISLNEAGIMEQLRDFLLSKQELTESLKIITFKDIDKEEFDAKTKYL